MTTTLNSIKISPAPSAENYIKIQSISDAPIASAKIALKGISVPTPKNLAPTAGDN